MLLFIVEEPTDGFFPCAASSQRFEEDCWLILIREHPLLWVRLSHVCPVSADKDQEGLRRSTSSTDHDRWEGSAFRLIASSPLCVHLFSGRRDAFRSWAASLVAFSAVWSSAGFHLGLSASFIYFYPSWLPCSVGGFSNPYFLFPLEVRQEEKLFYLKEMQEWEHVHIWA